MKVDEVDYPDLDLCSMPTWCGGFTLPTGLPKPNRNTTAVGRQGKSSVMAGRVGVWLDYICMPQKPLPTEEQPEFRRSPMALDLLVMSSTVLALRHAGDDYPVWPENRI